MAKIIKFDLLIDGAKVKTFEELQDNLHADILTYVKNGKLAKWFLSRDMTDKAEAVQAIDLSQSNLALMMAVCEALELEADEDILTDILAMPEQLAKAQQAASASNAVVELQEEEEDDTPPAPTYRMDWSGKDMSGRHFDGEDFSNCNLEGINLSNASLMRTNLSGANLKGANLTGAKLNRANLTNANLSGVKGDHVAFGYCDMTACNLTKASLTDSSFRGADLTDANLSEATLTECDFSEERHPLYRKKTVLVRTDFSFSDLRGSKLELYPDVSEGVKLTGTLR